MVTKRYLDDSDQDPHQPTDKRMRPAPTRPSLASVIGEVVMVKNLQNLFSAIEPLLRRVVREEVERVMRHICGRSITRSPSLRIELEAAPRLALRFTKSLCLPIFTGSRIVDMDGKPMQVVLVDKTSSSNIPALMRVEVVVLDGDFGGGEREEWTSEEFNDHIVRERRGKRPLLVASGGGGEVVQNSSSSNNNNNNNNNSSNNVSIIMRDGIGYLSGDIEFTDNSSWIRSRKFRVGVRVIMMPSSSTTDDHLRIREGITEPFVVKDHRGELYKKHHPPMLEDEVWRLEKIGKDGAFHKKLSSQGINTVQEFLKLSVVDPYKLRKILGIGMSDKMWEVTLKHARNCEMGKKVYIYRGPHFALFLNPICQLVRADINGQIILASHLNNVNRSYIDKLVREAYASWNTLEEVEAEGLLNDNISLLITRGEKVEQIPDDHNFGDKSRESYGGSNNDQLGCSEWSLNPTLLENIANVPFGFSPHNIATPSTSASASASGSITHSDGPAKWH